MISREGFIKITKRLINYLDLIPEKGLNSKERKLE